MTYQKTSIWASPIVFEQTRINESIGLLLTKTIFYWSSPITHATVLIFVLSLSHSLLQKYMHIFINVYTEKKTDFIYEVVWMF